MISRKFRKQITMVLFVALLTACHFAYRRQWADVIRFAGHTPSFWNSDLQLLFPSVITIRKALEPAVKADVIIGIGSAITSKRLRNVSESNLATKFQFFYMFLSTFCNTASARFDYKFYLGYDSSDKVFSRQRLRNAFQITFESATTSGVCRDRHIIVSSLTLLECNYTEKPAWTQNDVMLEAYLDNADYLYRINDDTRLLTANWTEKFISQLEKYTPNFIDYFNFGQILICCCCFLGGAS